jgi:hypothetical protein
MFELHSYTRGVSSRQGTEDRHRGERSRDEHAHGKPAFFKSSPVDDLLWHRDISYAALSTMVLNLPADIYRRDCVATVSGMSGAAAASARSRQPISLAGSPIAIRSRRILIGASLVPLLAVWCC